MPHNRPFLPHNFPWKCRRISHFLPHPIRSPAEGTLGQAYLGCQFRKLVSTIILDQHLMLKAIYTIDSMVYCLLLFTQNILLFLIVSNHFSMNVYWSPFDHLKRSCNNKAMKWPLKPGATFSIIIKCHFRSSWKVEHSRKIIHTSSTYQALAPTRCPLAVSC